MGRGTWYRLEVYSLIMTVTTISAAAHFKISHGRRTRTGRWRRKVTPMGLTSETALCRLTDNGLRNFLWTTGGSASGALVLGKDV